MKKILIRLAFVALCLVPCVATAQSSSINAFSPYSMYGIGELNTQGTLPMRSMGGVGVARRDGVKINLLNPASFSAVPRKSFLFDFGAEGQNYYNSQQVNGVHKRSAYNSFNFHEVALQFPLANRLGLGFGLTPYSSVGYRVKSSQIESDYGWADYMFQGEGDITEVKLGVGWEPFKRFSIGAALQYYWGSIDRTYIMTPTNIVDNTIIASSVGTDSYGISRFKAQFGLQYTVYQTQKRRLHLGATYDLGGNLRPNVTRSVHVGGVGGAPVRGDSTHLALSLPHQLAVGVYYHTPRVSLGFDYVYQNWESVNGVTSEKTTSGAEVAYANTHTYKFGVEYIPNYSDVRRFMNRVSYRAGVRYGDYNQTFGGHRIQQYAVTVGLGLPIHFRLASTIDIGFEYGSRGAPGNIAEGVSFVRQQYFKFSLGISIFASPESQEYWFVRPKYQ